MVAEGSLAILGQAGDLRRMVDDILVAARLDTSDLAYRPATVEACKIVDNAVGHFRRVGHEIRIGCEDAFINVDGPRLGQALHNLVSNALAHGRPPIEIVGRTQGDVYHLAVIDRGDGLPTERLADPFAPFAHAPEDITTANSLGLGLAIADSLARMVGRGIEYVRQEGRTVFAMTIPLEPSADHAVPLREERQAPYSSASPTKMGGSTAPVKTPAGVTTTNSTNV